MHSAETADVLLTVADQSPQGILIVSHQHTIVFINQTACQMFGLTHQNTLGKYLSELSDKLPPEIIHRLEEACNKPFRFKEHRFQTTVKACLSGFIFFFELIQEYKQATPPKQIAWLPETLDSLTAIPNRTHFTQLAEQVVARLKKHEAIALIVLDLRGLDQINEAVGHDGGDFFLQFSSKKLKEFSEKHESLYGRIGGDKFCQLVVYKTLSDWSLEDHAAYLQAYLSEPIEINGITVSASYSVGAATDSNQHYAISELLMMANIACLHSKTVGYPVTYDNSLSTLNQKQLKLKAELKKAFEEKEIVFYLQPTFNLRKNKVTGCEALIRWYHPELGLLHPQDFLTLLEDSSFIHEALEYTLSAIMEHICTLDKKVMVSVNFSEKNLGIPHLQELIVKLLKAYQIPPYLLCIELTETTIMTSGFQTKEILSKLRSLGIKISLDDYGTGYSSLARIKSLPIDQIKIDRTFVNSMRFSAKDKMIIASSIALAKNLGLEVVIEGVENKQQYYILKELGADIIQGFYFAKPESIEKVITFIKTINQ